MAVGVIDNVGGVMAGPDVHGAGLDAWARISGVPATSSLVGGQGDPSDAWHMPYNVDRARGRIVTGEQVTGPVGGPDAGMIGDWRDLLNWKHSPAPWLLLFTLAVVGLMQFRLMVRAGGAKRGVKANVGLG